MVMMLEIGELNIFEPVLIGLIYSIAVLCLVFSIFIFKIKSKKGDLKASIFLFFISYFLSLFFGATTHGFFPNLVSGRLILWKISLVSFGLSGFFMWTIAGNLLSLKNKKIIYLIAIFEFLIYQFYVTVINTNFKIALYNYLLATFILFIGFYSIKKTNASKYGFGGIIFVLIASAFYFLKININTNLNHIFLYHFLMGVSLIFLFVYFKEILSVKLNK
ncbi:MAG: hypothetical protein AABY16_03305 [Nanoarchaeota archaeon]